MGDGTGPGGGVVGAGLLGVGSGFGSLGLGFGLGFAAGLAGFFVVGLVLGSSFGFVGR